MCGGAQGTDWGTRNVQYLDLGDGFKGVYKNPLRCTLNICILLNVISPQLKRKNTFKEILQIGRYNYMCSR